MLKALIIISIFVLIIIVTTSRDILYSIYDKYRCSPMLIFAPYFNETPQDNIKKCISGFNFNFVDVVMAPVYSMIGSISDNAAGASKMTDLVSVDMSSMAGGLTSLTGNFLGMFTNMFAEFHYMLTGVTDSVYKMSGIIVTMIYMLDGLMKTAKSIYNGLPGKLVDAMACFDKNTEIRLQNNKVKKIKNIILGDILENGETVTALIKIRNLDKKNKIIENFYKIKETNSNNYVKVTGSHMILNKITGKYVKVSDHPLSIPTFKGDAELYCINTTNHEIPIGGHIFWDWEDNLL
tara:strand:+ start:1179 stop:2057 length:879 start_codon:yes stop_codon:yes gene_type:complete